MYQGCSWIGGRCVATGSTAGTCLGWGQSDCLNIPGCQWLQSQCSGAITCDSGAPSAGPQTYYASEGKHALYHTDSECDAGVWWQDNCGSNAYSARSYAVDRGLLQNVGESWNHDRFDHWIAEPSRSCGENDVWDPNMMFGSSTAYAHHFNYQFGWILPPKPVCGDRRCDALSGERCYDVFTGAGCQADCGTCAYCGDGRCNGSETQATCPSDCQPMCDGGVCRDGSCCPRSGVCPDGRACLL
jgi:hypothetical protein